ncbi:MAG: FtsX-like permease family protein [Rikenellaceae bacterium]
MFLIARRYLLSPKSHSVVNIIAGVSLLSLLTPVAAVIILLSVFNGFGAMIGEAEQMVDGDLTLSLSSGRLFEMADLDLSSVEGVEAMSFSTQQTVLLEHRGESQLVELRGVDEHYDEVVAVWESIFVGAFDVGDDGEEASIVLAESMAAKLGARRVGESLIEVISPKMGALQSVVSMGGVASQQARLSGIYSVDYQSEQSYAYASQRVVNQLLGRDGVATRLSVRLADRADERRVRAQIEAIVGDRFRVENRSELNPAIHQVLRYEKMGVLLICSFVMALACFSLVGAMSMLMLEKRADVETLRAMGASNGLIRRIFLYEGVLIGGVAIVMGVVLGVVVTLIQQWFGVITLPTSALMTIPYPVELRVGDIVAVVLIAGVIALSLSSLVVNVMLRRWLKK